MLNCVCFTTSDSGEIPVEDELVAVVGIVVVIVSIFIVVTVVVVAVVSVGAAYLRH